MNIVKRFFYNLLTSGTYSKFEIGARSRIIFLNAVMIFGIPFLFYFSASSYFHAEKVLALSTLITGSVVVLVFIIVRAFKAFMLGNFFLVTIMLALYSYLVYSGGEGGSGFLWIYSYPLISIFLLRFRTGSIYAVILMIWCGVTFFVPELSPYTYPMSYYQRIIGVYILIMIFAITYELVRSSTHKRMMQINNHLQETTAQLSAAKSRTDTIMGNVEQGIFLLDSQLCFAAEYSRYLSKIFNKSDFASMHIMDVLGPYLSEKDALATKDYLELFFKGDVNSALLKDINPIEQVEITLPKIEGRRRNATLHFYFEGIRSPDGAPMIIGLVNDISEEVELQRIRDEDKNTRTKNVETLFSILHTEHSMLAEFLGDCEQELDDIRKLLQDRDKSVGKLLTELYQRIHSMKGNAVLLELNRFAESAHELEDKIKQMLDSNKARTEDILDLIYDTSSLENELNDIRNMINKLRDFQTAADEEAKISGLIIKTIQQTVRRQAEMEEKEVNLDISHFNTAVIPDKHRKIMKDLLIQLIRNSVSHGIETSDERLAAGKPQAGTLTIQTETTGSEIRISVKDDGCGIIPSKILKAAQNIKSLKNRDLSSLPENQVIGLIFHPGFSTRSESDMSAGRGIGMNLIKSRIEEAGGKLRVKTAPGKYTRFSVVFPA